MLQRVKREVESAHLIQNDHVERSSCCSLVYISVHMEAALIGAPMNQRMNEPAIVVECENHGCFFGEERIE